MSSMKSNLIKLIEKLSERQVEYLYHLVRNLFGQTPD